jgi:hypothetical protein
MGLSTDVAERGHVRNLLSLYHYSTDWEKQEGTYYYNKQYGNILKTMLHHPDLELPIVHKAVAAFCVLSPNQTEKTNYQALDRCLKIVTGQLPEDASVSAYGKNRAKALAILRGGSIDELVTGLEDRAFYHNTINPDDSTHVTIDGHMLSAWCGRRILLKTREANISAVEYKAVADDMRIAANFLGYSAPRLQAILWLAWKRVNRIVYSAQTSFDYSTESAEYVST